MPENTSPAAGSGLPKPDRISARVGELIATATARPVRQASDELRALMVYDAAPPGHSTVEVDIDDWHYAPHLKPGEIAVVDECDREPIEGELYAVEFKSTAPRRSLAQVSVDRRDGNDKWWMIFGISRSFSRPLTPDEVCAGYRAGLVHYKDGPCSLEHLRTLIRGRVVGVILAPEAVR